jgi:hypothetical protein
MHEWQRLSHVRWECKYQVVIIATGMPNRSPQRGLPHVYGPLGGAFLMPRPMAVVDYSDRHEDVGDVQAGFSMRTGRSSDRGSPRFEIEDRFNATDNPSG